MMFAKRVVFESIFFCRLLSTRRTDLSTLASSDVEFFRKLLGSDKILMDDWSLTKYNMDWTGQYKGSSKLVLFPTNTNQVSEILKYCNDRQLGIVPQGGNTGLVGGSVPVFDEIILSTNLLNKILNFEKTTGVVICEAGCILESLNDFVAKEGHTVPLDLGAKGSCQIGGNISTNAGGGRLIRYGSLHGNVLGLEVVLPSGEVLDLNQTLRKDNTGYDLKQLFIGSEGTLGVITKASILCPYRSSTQNTCLMLVNDITSALKVFKKAQMFLGEILSAMEFMDSESYSLVFDVFKDYQKPVPYKSKSIYLLLETLGSQDSHDKEKISMFLEDILSQGLVQDGVLAQDLGQVRNMWKIRESITESLRHNGYVYKYDLTLPHLSIYELVEETRLRLLQCDCIIVGFGHLGDGNLHLNIASHEPKDKILSLLEPFVFDWTLSKKGSISAEHGLGVLKADKIHHTKSAIVIEWMLRMKQLMDPNGILNPYKVFPTPLLQRAKPFSCSKNFRHLLF